MTKSLKNILLAGIIVSVGGISAYGVAQAAPDMGVYFQSNPHVFNAGPDVTAARASSFRPTIHMADAGGGHFGNKPLVHMIANAADPAGGNFGNAVRSDILPMQNVAEFTNVYPPFASSAQAAIDNGIVNNSNPLVQTALVQPHSALADISLETKTASHGASVNWQPVAVEFVAFRMQPKVNTAMVRHTSEKCEALDAKLDKQHLKLSVENRILAKHGCGVTPNKTI